METIKFSDIPYNRPDIPAVLAEYAALTTEFQRATTDLAATHSAIAKWDHLRSSLSTMSHLVNIRYHQDTSSPFLQGEKKFFDDLEPTLKEEDLKIARWLVDHPLRSQLEAKWGAQIFNIYQTQLESFSPAIADAMRAEAELSRRYTDLLAQAQVEFAGKTMNLSALRRHTMSSDRRERMEAQRVRASFFKANDAELDTIYHDLVQTRHTMAKTLGYDSFIPLGYKLMTRTDYTAKDVARFRDEIHRHIVPLAQSLREAQRKRLEVDELYFYDEPVMHRHGNPKPNGDIHWIVAQSMTMFKQMGPQTEDFFTLMMESGLLDLGTRPNKAGGGFCTELPDYRVPFIFANFNGTHEDVSTLAHECGHAFQSYMSREAILIDYLFPTLEACEIHSMSMELLSFPYMDLFFGDAAHQYRQDHLAEAILFLPYAAAVDEFQHMVYQAPHCTPQDRRHFWKEMEAKYLPWRNYAHFPHASEGGLWQGQGHIYSVPFYYIDYALAQTCALQLWQRTQINPKQAFDDYLALCRPGGRLSFTELIREGNLISPFEPGCLTDVVKAVKAVIG